MAVLSAVKQLLLKMPLLEKNTTYFIFIYEPKSRSEGEYLDYVVPDPFDGYVRIVDGIIQPHNYSRFYKEGTNVDTIKEWIENAIDAPSQ